MPPLPAKQPRETVLSFRTQEPSSGLASRRRIDFGLQFFTLSQDTFSLSPLSLHTDYGEIYLVNVVLGLVVEYRLSLAYRMYVLMLDTSNLTNVYCLYVCVLIVIN